MATMQTSQSAEQAKPCSRPQNMLVDVFQCTDWKKGLVEIMAEMLSHHLLCVGSLTLTPNEEKKSGRSLRPRYRVHVSTRLQ